MALPLRGRALFPGQTLTISVRPGIRVSGSICRFRYGDRFSFEGGYDSTGKPGYSETSIEEVLAEVDRCFRDYGNRKGFMFAPVLLGSVTAFKEKMAAVIERANTLRFAGK